MKFKLLFLALLGIMGIANAQFTITNTAGETLGDGAIINGDLMVNYDFFVTNNSSDIIYTRAEVVDIINATGDRFEFCYGECLTSISIGTTVPPAPFTIDIAPGETTGPGNHFLNGDAGNGTDILDYVFRFHQYDSSGTTEIGSPVTITYRYNPALSISGNSKVNLTIQSTVVRDRMVLNINEPVQMTMYDIQGRLVKQAHFEGGSQSVNVSDLSAQTYIVQFKNNTGAVMTTKIVVQ
ncbi:T9SS type A sorting domain-containing protein [Aequorivita sp. H23M31]|uniref:T9SS type A sorting domain-containing protein n=1 Tax=Aequorivita ciconiae TaxID=2494375 RepID=A0A410G6E6_9FLAO|nr:T9SS type A sorting domain-containing protein [Aequorivita sp. H23M31]QAA82864.1 T9SS type A sorting domain-containing protein [Aequorivita sp. H23M31]